MLQKISYLYGLDPMVGFALVVIDVQVQTSWVKGSLVTSDSSVATADRSGPSDAGTVVAVAGDGTVQTGLGTVLRIQYPQNILMRETVEQFFKHNFFKGNTSKTAILMMLKHIRCSKGVPDMHFCKRFRQLRIKPIRITNTVYIGFCDQLPSEGSGTLNPKEVAKSSGFQLIYYNRQSQNTVLVVARA